jgi:SAM-dependent methyltransferase
MSGMPLAEHAVSRGVDGPGAARAAFERLARWMIEVELPAAGEFLPAAERETFERYYQSLPGPGDHDAIRRYLDVLWWTEAGWTARWIAAFAARSGRAPRVLDAGSGFGTYAMLYAAAGAEVVGADLRPDRLSAADRRLEFHRARAGTSLAVRHLRADLTAEWPGRFDLVWVYNALSHIDPLDRFLTLTRDQLDPGGVLVVGDLNGAHAGQRRRLDRLRGEVHQHYVAPDGRRHTYAVERPFPPAELRALVEGAGLRVVHHELYWPGGSHLPASLRRALLEPLQRRWRLGSGFARRQLLAATPAATAGGR